MTEATEKEILEAPINELPVFAHYQKYTAILRHLITLSAIEQFSAIAPNEQAKNGALVVKLPDQTEHTFFSDDGLKGFLDVYLTGYMNAKIMMGAKAPMNGKEVHTGVDVAIGPDETVVVEVNELPEDGPIPTTIDRWLQDWGAHPRHPEIKAFATELDFQIETNEKLSDYRMSPLLHDVPMIEVFDGRTHHFLVLEMKEDVQFGQKIERFIFKSPGGESAYLTGMGHLVLFNEFHKRVRAFQRFPDIQDIVLKSMLNGILDHGYEVKINKGTGTPTLYINNQQAFIEKLDEGDYRIYSKALNREWKSFNWQNERYLDMRESILAPQG